MSEKEKPEPAPEPGPVTDSQAADLARLEHMAAEGETGPGGQGPAPEPEPDIPTAQILAPVIDLLCSVFAPNWNISQPEKNTLANAYASVIDKYFPGGLPMGCELTALLVTGAIIGPRLSTPRVKPEPEPKKPEKEVSGEKVKDANQ